ncbi:hypothetical protein [Streptomyces sp. NPDC053541]|uniref:hypothetical protein n=1 Tax=Streptomyces sp. NPDC053541 TaxID=3365709 RepID=UPI0037CEC48F
MKAARFHGKEDVRIEEVPEPSPGPGQAKLRSRGSRRPDPADPDRGDDPGHASLVPVGGHDEMIEEVGLTRRDVAIPRYLGDEILVSVITRKDLYPSGCRRRSLALRPPREA